MVMLGIVLLLVTLVVHEAGHAIAMMRRGVEIEEAGVGLPLTGKLRLTFRPRFLPFPVVVTPVPFGAYVRPSDKGAVQLKELSYKDQAICYSAGIVTNLVFGSALLSILFSVRAITGDSHVKGAVVVALIAGGIAAAAAIFRRAFARIVPLLGLVALLSVIFVLVDSLDNVGGPVEVFKIAAGGKNIAEMLLICAAISLSLAHFNLLPLIPLDGGKVVQAFLETRGRKRLSVAFSVMTGLVFVGFIVFLIVSGRF